MHSMCGKEEIWHQARPHLGCFLVLGLGFLGLVRLPLHLKLGWLHLRASTTAQHMHKHQLSLGDLC